MKSGDWESGFFLSILVKLSVANLFSYWPEKDFIFSKLDCQKKSFSEACKIPITLKIKLKPSALRFHPQPIVTFQKLKNRQKKCNCFPCVKGTGTQLIVLTHNQAIASQHTNKYYKLQHSCCNTNDDKNLFTIVILFLLHFHFQQSHIFLKIQKNILSTYILISGRPIKEQLI